MPSFFGLGALHWAVARAREAVLRFELRSSDAEEAARLAAARELDAEEVGRRADERARAREAPSTEPHAPMRE